MSLEFQQLNKYTLFSGDNERLGGKIVLMMIRAE